jgi:hypothetical protein
VINVDMAKARNIWRDKLRAEREPLFDGLDHEQRLADEAGDAALVADIIRRKKLLRDAPQDPRIDSAATPDELRRVTLQ